jgi:Glycosyl transferase family 2
MARQVVVERDRDGKPLPASPCPHGVEKLACRHDPVVTAEMVKLPLEGVGRDGGQNLAGGVTRLPADAVVDEGGPCSRRREARAPAEEEREQRAPRVRYTVQVVQASAFGYNAVVPLKIVLTLLAWNEADVVDAHVAFHLNAGVDFILAIDNGSDDGTTEILESYARQRHLDLVRDGGDLRQSEWVTALARRAATEFGADWVINSDADEFWWPRTGSLKDVLAAVPERFGSVRGMWRHFAPRPYGDEFFAERMTVRVCNPGAEESSPYSPRYKTAHRGYQDVTVLHGNHTVLAEGLRPLEGWYPIDVLHFPIRSLEQCTSKYLRWQALAPSRFRTAAYDAHREGQMRDFYESYVVDDEGLGRGLAEGTLAVDTRLRDALRALQAGKPLAPSDGTVDAAYLSELSALADADPQVLAQRKADDLDARVARLQQRAPAARILRAVSARVRGA